MEQNDAPKENVFYARLGIVVKPGQEPYCAFCPKVTFANTQGGSSHAHSSTIHKEHRKTRLASVSNELLMQGIVRGPKRSGWQCVPCGVQLRSWGEELWHHLGETHATEMKRWTIRMEDNISSKKRRLQDVDVPQEQVIGWLHDIPEQPPAQEEQDEMEGEAYLEPWYTQVIADLGHNAAVAVATTPQPQQLHPEFAAVQEEAIHASSAAYSTWDWILAVMGLSDRVSALEVRFDQLERAGPAGGGGGGGNPGSGSPGGGSGLDPGRYGGGQDKDQDKDAGGDQGVQQGGGHVVMSYCTTWCYGAVYCTLVLAPTLLPAWLRRWSNNPKNTVAFLFVVAVLALMWLKAAPAAPSGELRYPAQAPPALAVVTNQSLDTTSNRERSPAATAKEPTPQSKAPAAPGCRQDPFAGSAWDKMGRSDSSKQHLYPCA